MNVNKKQELKNYVVNSIVHNAFDLNELLRLINLLPDQPQLNENQQIVLEWLQDKFTLTGKSRAIGVVYALHEVSRVTDFSYGEAWQAYRELKTAEEAEVLRAFSDWVLVQEEK